MASLMFFEKELAFAVNAFSTAAFAAVRSPVHGSTIEAGVPTIIQWNPQNLGDKIVTMRLQRGKDDMDIPEYNIYNGPGIANNGSYPWIPALPSDPNLEYSLYLIGSSGGVAISGNFKITKR